MTNLPLTTPSRATTAAPAGQTTLTAIILALLLASPCFGQSPEAKTKPKPTTAKTTSFEKGMVISCPGMGRSWGSDAMVEKMKYLKTKGVNSIQIHPYAGIRKNGQVVNRSYRDALQPPTWITRPIIEAKKLGMKIMVKPHLAYWGSGFDWRGSIKFQTNAEWDRFFREYGEWIVKMAIMSKGADVFVVGTELDRTIHHEKAWRQIIARIRKVFSGRITYAANWTDYHLVKFWDDLDAIGIQAYFPLAPETKPQIMPNRVQLVQGWRDIIRRLDAAGKKAGKTILLTELGYNRSFQAPFRPWEHPTDGKDAEAIQILCLDVALESLPRSKFIKGAYLWKCFPGARSPRNFNHTAPAILKVIEKRWALPKPALKTPTPKTKTKSESRKVGS